MKKIHHLEGVRAIGALIVFVCHFQIAFVPAFYDLFLLKLKTILPAKLSSFIVYLVDLNINGNMFLHIFWALSAYVIFKKFFQYTGQQQFLLSASVKRYFRLMIPCAASIFFSYFLFKAGFIYITRIHIHVLQQNLYAFPPSFLHALKDSIWNTLFDYDFYNSYNGPLWTIEREFYGSLFCFALFGIIGKAKNRAIFYAIIFGCVFMLKMYWLNSFLFGYYLSDYDFSEKTASPVYNIIDKINKYIERHQTLAFLLFLLVFMAGRIVLYKKPWDLDMINSVLCFLVIFITLRIDFITRLMSLKILTGLGKISFGLYLLHWPIMCAFSAWFYVTFNHDTNASLTLLFVLTTVIALFLSWLFYKYIDLNSIKWSGKIASYFKKITDNNAPVVAIDKQAKSA